MASLGVDGAVQAVFGKVQLLLADHSICTLLNAEA